MQVISVVLLGQSDCCGRIAACGVRVEAVADEQQGEAIGDERQHDGCQELEVGDVAGEAAADNANLLAGSVLIVQPPLLPMLSSLKRSLRADSSLQ